VIPNLYLIGTMNTADRSIGHIDYAVRRRFAFVPLRPERTIIAQQTNDKVCTSGLALFDAVAALFSTIGFLAPDFHADDVQVGHTYFLARNQDVLFGKFAYQVYPLLREYYKDGVLVPNAGEPLALQVNGRPLSIEPPALPTRIMLNTCFASQNTSPQTMQSPGDAVADAEEPTV
jgi:hypothetical protein